MYFATGTGLASRMMDVAEALRRRISVRAFLADPVPRALLDDCLALAARAPSGGNLQPWHIHVLEGAALDRLKSRMAERLLTPGHDPLDYNIYPANLWEPYRSRRFQLAEQMYALMGIPRSDKPARLAHVARNFQFFGAPVGLFCYVDRGMGAPQWSDLGMYLQSLLLLLQSNGIGSCAQEAWSQYAATVAEVCQPPPGHMLFCGIAVGHPDPSAPVNALRSERAPPADFITRHDS